MAAIRAPLARYLNRHEGKTAWVVGRGLTDFEYERLAKCDGPVFFVNDAVQLERHLTNQPSYFCALDVQVIRTWLAQKLKSVALLPMEFSREHGADDNVIVAFKRDLGRFEKERTAISKRELLHVSWGTIAPLLHFAWYTGCAAVRFIGCDGISRPQGKEYDDRLENRSKSVAGGVYARIKATQEQMCLELGLPYLYVGTPRAYETRKLRIVSFATPKYEPLMMVLAESLAGFGIPTHLEAVRDRGSWAANQAWKPEFLWLMQEEFPAERLVWLDADAVVMQYPDLFWTLADDVDLAVHYREGRELLSGTVYLGPTLGARQIVEAWRKAQARKRGQWDQQTLQMVLQDGPQHWRLEKLPASYTYIYDTFAKLHPGIAPVIEHYQNSRSKR